MISAERKVFIMTTEEKLKEMMKRKSGSVNKFAKEIGMPQGTLAGILDRGFVNASLKSAIKICDGLGISLNDVVHEITGGITAQKTTQNTAQSTTQTTAQDVEFRFTPKGSNTEIRFVKAHPRRKQPDSERLTQYLDALAETFEKIRKETNNEKSERR